MEEVYPSKFYSKKEWEILRKESEKYPTPNTVTDLALVKESFNEIKKEFSYAKIFCAIKANPDRKVMKLLKELESNFDVASTFEIDQLMSVGVDPSKLSFGNTIKKPCDIKYAYEKGVRLFVTDSEGDLKSIAENAPGSNVFFRLLLFPKVKSSWPLCYKFGAEEDVVKELIVKAKELGLVPKGLSFHVGSQQTTIEAWEAPIETCANIYKEMKEKHQIELDYLNLGGGLPGRYFEDVPSLHEYATTIKSYLDKYFPDGVPKNVVIEPGRGVFAKSSIMATSVVLVAKKSNKTNDRWVFIDAGVYNGLLDAIDECIHYPLYTTAKGELSSDFIIAGPTCDSFDIIYRKFRNPLPKDIKTGDRIYLLQTGAYTNSSCMVEFNGFPPTPCYIIDSSMM